MFIKIRPVQVVLINMSSIKQEYNSYWTIIPLCFPSKVTRIRVKVETNTWRDRVVNKYVGCGLTRRYRERWPDPYSTLKIDLKMDGPGSLPEACSLGGPSFLGSVTYNKVNPVWILEHTLSFFLAVIGCNFSKTKVNIVKLVLSMLNSSF